MTRYRVYLALGIALSLLLLVVATGAKKEVSGGYKVRAIFDNANFVIKGEEVKIAGVKVGQIAGLTVTRQKKAAVTLDITEPGFQDFRQDATCQVRPQSLIGEQFVECRPTAPRRPGQTAPPPLPKIADGKPGAGQRLLPLKTRFGGGTSSPVGIDLINNTLRLPYRERLALIINELGTGLAANGGELRNVVRRANPALDELDRVLAILARENKTLADLTVNGDRVLAPLARDKARVTRAIARTADVNTAVAERSDALEGNLERLPTFLRELRPTMVKLGELSDEATPVVASLGRNAPSINRLIRELGPFSEAARPAVRSLGRAAVIGRPALIATRPLARQLQTLGRDLAPVANVTAALLKNFNQRGGVEYALKYLYYQAAAINGFDAFGHYLRAGLLTTDVAQCSFYATTRDDTCSANFGNAANVSARRGARAQPAKAQLLQKLAALGYDVNGKNGKKKGDAKPLTPAGTAPAAPATPRTAEGAAATPSPGKATPSPGKATPTPSAPATQATKDDPTAGLLDYLLGNGRSK